MSRRWPVPTSSALASPNLGLDSKNPAVLQFSEAKVVHPEKPAGMIVPFTRYGGYARCGQYGGFYRGRLPDPDWKIWRHAPEVHRSRSGRDGGQGGYGEGGRGARPRGRGDLWTRTARRCRPQPGPPDRLLRRRPGRGAGVYGE